MEFEVRESRHSFSPDATLYYDESWRGILAEGGQTLILGFVGGVAMETREEDGLMQLDDGETMHPTPTSADPVQALRGIGKGEGLLSRLLKHRREDRKQESKRS
jgi:hypothetical protein